MSNISEEEIIGMKNILTYPEYSLKCYQSTFNLKKKLQEMKNEGYILVGYGAAAKGNTLMNYAGIKPDLIRFVCDAAPSKQNKYMPGNHLPIFHPDEIEKFKPDWIVIFPWNIADEIINSHKQLQNNGTQMVTVIPEIKFL